MAKIVVGMSGGVDSAVAASLLKEQGFDVVGVSLKLWDAPETLDKTTKTCCSLDDVEDARAVAFALNIPFYVLNMKQAFMEKVVDYFTDAYLEGTTPNPCIACNRFIKFQAMLDKALSLDADYIATGHYAQVVQDPDTGRFLMKKAADRKKDQTYVLYMLTQEQLRHIRFPLGGMTKDQVRVLAKQASEQVSKKPDSQDICFVPDGDYAAFIQKHTGKASLPGHFITTDGRDLGPHKGIAHYTIGQRKGLGLALDAPHFVLNKDMQTGNVLIGKSEYRYRSSLVAKEMNYISFAIPPATFRATAKVRYSASEHEVTVTPQNDGRARIVFDQPQPDIAPGQAVVLYDGEYVIGGGVIESAQ